MDYDTARLTYTLAQPWNLDAANAIVRWYDDTPASPTIDNNDAGWLTAEDFINPVYGTEDRAIFVRRPGPNAASGVSIDIGVYAASGSRLFVRGIVIRAQQRESQQAYNGFTASISNDGHTLTLTDDDPRFMSHERWSTPYNFDILLSETPNGPMGLLDPRLVNAS